MKGESVTAMALCGIAATVAPKYCAAAQKANDEKRPNVIFVLTDQLRNDVFGFRGDCNAVTPNIDAFASESADFTNAVAVSPVSAAMRASLFTGKYTSSTGMVINELRLNPDHHALADVLSENGYRTAYYGKWHLYSNCSQHFADKCAYIPPGEHRLGFDDEWKGYNFRHNYFNGFYYEDEVKKKYYGEGVYEPEAQFEFAMDYLERVTGPEKTDEPFALFLSVGIPHNPWTKGNVPEKYYEMFENIEFEYPETWSDIPDPYMDRYNDPDEWLNKVKPRILEEKKVYYAMVASLDVYMGRLMHKIEELGLDENTIVIFTSDHGEMFGEHGRIQKMIFYEAAARVPFLVRWKGHIKPGKKLDACINSPDIMPTLLGAVGLSDKIPEEVEGMDLSPMLFGKKCKEPEFALMQGMGHTYIWKDGYEWRSVRDKRYTYAVYKKDNKELLFDNLKDPLQQNNLADDPGMSRIKEKMRTEMFGKMSELGDTFENCTWYRDHWVDGNRCIQAAAKGKFRQQ